MPSTATARPDKGTLTATRIGGVDPAIIRELSGIYKPFVKAFKELVSNAFDADADRVDIRLAEDLRSIEIEDDGRGLTPFEFRSDFTRLGGSYTRLREGLTQKGRPKIGSKGIGFLAVARYCSRMTVVSSSTRTHKGYVRAALNGKELDLGSRLDAPVARELLDTRLKVRAVEVYTSNDPRPVDSDTYDLYDGHLVFRRSPSRSPSAEVGVAYELDCRGLEFSATIDFDYLLSLENKQDLEEIQDFCTIDVYEPDAARTTEKRSYTRIVLSDLKPFVVRELAASQRQGFVRNVESKAGVARFVWNLQRCVPVEYDLPEAIREKFGAANLEHPEIKHIAEVRFSGPGYSGVALRRPVWGQDESHPIIPDNDISVAVDINEDGLVAKGYILGCTEVLFPAEYRGLAVRVRNVQIGAPNFLGAEGIATGAMKAALSQITGEINVIRGLDAIDALNPGRESFYEENGDYKRLRSHLVGEGESIGGLLQRVIKGILMRGQVTSSVADLVSRTTTRRKSLTNLSLAINHLATTPEYADGLRRLFTGRRVAARRLRGLKPYELELETKVTGFRVVSDTELGEEYRIDFAKKVVRFNQNHDLWSWKISLLGERYDVELRVGTKSDPLCELDTQERVVFLNWGHPLRTQMGDTSFIRSAIAWTVAHHASGGSVDGMMSMALGLISFD